MRCVLYFLTVFGGLCGVVWGEVQVSFQYEAMIGGRGSGQGQFLEPEALALDMSGQIFVADTGNDRVQKLNAEGAYVTEAGGFGWDPGQFNKPNGIATNKGLTLYVSDSRNFRIQVFNLQLRLLAVFGGADANGPVELGTLGGIAVSESDVVYVSDIDADQLVQIDSYSRIDRSFGGFGYGAGRLRRPLDLAVDKEGKTFVCDSENDRIAVFDRFGNFKRALGEEILLQPSGVCVGPDRTLIVADTGHHRVVVFDLDTGDVAMHVGGPDPGRGPMSFAKPRDVALGAAGMLYVLESGNCRIQKLQMRVSRR